MSVRSDGSQQGRFDAALFVVDADFCRVGFNLGSTEQPAHFLQRARFVAFDN